MPAPVVKLGSWKSTMSNPSIVLPLEPGARSNASSPLRVLPLSSMIGVPAYPGWGLPSIRTGTVMAGKGDSTLITYGAEPLVIEKVILLGPGVAALDLRIAWRNDTSPGMMLESEVVVTTKDASSILSSTRSASSRRRVCRGPERLDLLMLQSHNVRGEFADRLSGHDPGKLLSNMTRLAGQSIDPPEFMRTAKKVLVLTILMIVQNCRLSDDA